MKTKLYITIVCTLCLLLTSCHTALYIAPQEKLSADFREPNMEFIGFINAPHDEKIPVIFEGFGRELERNKIAFNSQTYSLGSMFNMDDLKNSHFSSRYVSFVNIMDLRVNYDDEIKDNKKLVTAGWWIAVCLVFVPFPIYVPMMVAGDKNYCQQSIQLKAELCIYDTFEKNLISLTPITLNHKEIYKGQYEHKKTNKRQLEASEKSVLTNAVLEQYGYAHAFIQQQIDAENIKLLEEQKAKEAEKQKSVKKKKSKKK